MQGSFVFTGMKDGSRRAANHLSTLGARNGADMRNVTVNSSGFVSVSFDEAAMIISLLPNRVRFETGVRLWDGETYAFDDKTEPLASSEVLTWLLRHHTADGILLEKNEDGFLFAFQGAEGEYSDDEPVLFVIF